MNENAESAAAEPLLDWFSKLPRACEMPHKGPHLAPDTDQTGLIAGVYKAEFADFQVDESLDFEPAGKGDHVWLKLQKTGLNTEFVKQKLQTLYGVSSRDVGFSGLKDRNALTSQWFSIDASLVDKTRIDELTKSVASVSGLQLLEATRHQRKIRHGTHALNRFKLILRNISLSDKAQAAGAYPTSLQPGGQPGLQESVDARLLAVRECGFPNYFMRQRFGHAGRNLLQAQRLFTQRRFRPSRAQRGLYLSAARSRVFNAVCAARLQAGTWLQPQSGEPLLLGSSRSYFLDGDDNGGQQDLNNESETNAHVAAASPALGKSTADRVASGDVHTSGPLWGRGQPPGSADFAQWESQFADDFRVFCEGLESVGLKQERRALRAMASELTWNWLDAQTLEINFGLGRGVYATALLRELGYFQDASTANPGSAIPDTANPDNANPGTE